MNRFLHRSVSTRSTKVLTLCLAGMTSLLLATTAHAQATLSFTVPGSANPFLAGMPDGSMSNGNDTAPGQSPLRVTGFDLSGGGILTFSVTGAVDYSGGTPTNAPDGDFFFSVSSENGISGYTAPVDALVGVFLTDDQPDGSAAPADLDFSTGDPGLTFGALSPALKQTFFIGDGLTGNGTGSVQSFHIPAGATRFYLGTVDGSGWFNNTGSFQVDVTGPTAAAAPEPGALPLLSLAAFPLIASVLQRRKSLHQ